MLVFLLGFREGALLDFKLIWSPMKSGLSVDQAAVGNAILT